MRVGFYHIHLCFVAFILRIVFLLSWLVLPFELWQKSHVISPPFCGLWCFLIDEIESSEWTKVLSAFSLDTNKTINRDSQPSGAALSSCLPFVLLGNKQVGERSNYLLREGVERQFALKWLSQICHIRFVSSWFGWTNNRNIIKWLQGSGSERFFVWVHVILFKMVFLWMQFVQEGQFQLMLPGTSYIMGRGNNVGVIWLCP